jgi:hypothetical protein
VPAGAPTVAGPPTGPCRATDTRPRQRSAQATEARLRSRSASRSPRKARRRPRRARRGLGRGEGRHLRLQLAHDALREATPKGLSSCLCAAPPRAGARQRSTGAGTHQSSHALFLLGLHRGSIRELHARGQLVRLWLCNRLGHRLCGRLRRRLGPAEGAVVAQVLQVLLGLQRQVCAPVELLQALRAGVVVDHRQPGVTGGVERLLQVQDARVDVLLRIPQAARVHAHVTRGDRPHLHDPHRAGARVLAGRVQPRLLVSHRHRQIPRHPKLFSPGPDDLGVLPLLLVQARQEGQVRHRQSPSNC